MERFDRPNAPPPMQAKAEGGSGKGLDGSRVGACGPPKPSPAKSRYALYNLRPPSLPPGTSRTSNITKFQQAASIALLLSPTDEAAVTNDPFGAGNRLLFSYRTRPLHPDHHFYLVRLP
ncbi:hypothetical protein E4U22_006601 [Claviceps purpurea]|nr:hypothetical protein E4U12_004245 [Claviceps purpurea]KAG6157018.1 hypothetical protein E4U11_005414 [Claviceps purpurea]KAG6160138.1 hypothetical protein E4U37_001252 [Claviceps purpurea]KAG6170207.1 hypothetical protein E4U51_001020 [Claviceps purpurea]KAG6182981.1 hypothetical protein E4U36_002974 [Claviceps purpurea]